MLLFAVGVVTSLGVSIGHSLIFSTKDTLWVHGEWWDPVGYSFSTDEFRKFGMCRRAVRFGRDQRPRFGYRVSEHRAIYGRESGKGVADRTMFPWEWGIAGRLGRNANELIAGNRGVRYEDARGFPFFALRCELLGSGWVPDTPEPTGVRSGIKIAHWGSVETPFSVRVVPLQPIWLGLLADSVFYAGLIALTLNAARHRRTARARRGLCPACAYDLEGQLAAGCPECGWRRPTSPEGSS